MQVAAPRNQSGKLAQVTIPNGNSSIDQYRKGLSWLFEYQVQNRGGLPWPNPTHDKSFKASLKNHKHKLKYDEVNADLDRDAHCSLRESYTPAELCRVLKSLWKKTTVRELFAICARHHFLFRDQDIRNLNFADCFAITAYQQYNRGMQKELVMVISLNKGKTIREGETRFACALRHENITRCPISAFAFYVFSLLQVCELLYISV